LWEDGNVADTGDLWVVARDAVDAIASSNRQAINFVVIGHDGEQVDASPMFDLLGERQRHVELVLKSFEADEVTDHRVGLLLDVEVRFMGARWAHQPATALEVIVDEWMVGPERFALSLASACDLLETFHTGRGGCVLERAQARPTGPTGHGGHISVSINGTITPDR
jgi:hypothetical protein